MDMEHKAFNLDTIKEKLNSWFSHAIGGGTLDGKFKIISLGIKKEMYIKALISLGIVWAIAFLLIGFAIYQNMNLNARLPNLNNLENYDLQSFKSDALITTDAPELRTFDEMIEYYNSALGIKNRVKGELDFKRSVYSDFLRNLLLPSLNIWKNPYTEEVDLSLLGKKYLDNNPYQDVTLLQQWWGIIRDSGQNIWVNEVVNMQIGDIVEEKESGFFHIPISIDFKSDSKRAFLLLVDKLSQTSNVNNIGLFNDFTFHLFEVIRDKKPTELAALAQQYKIPSLSGNDQRIFNNKVISQHLYEFIKDKDQTSSPLLDAQVIDQVIKHSASCSASESQESCYFRFRDKYRSLPSLAYTIGQRNGANKVLLLKDFYKNIPPLIAIESFVFDKAEDTGMTLAEQGAYAGTVSFKIYGRGISSDDAEQLGQLLTTQCYGSGSKTQLTLESALQRVNDQLSRLSTNENSSEWKVSRVGNLIELKEDFEEDIKEYENLSPYAQIIKKFEVLRSLKNLSLCQQ